MADHVIAVVGNPNCGKTTLFNALTGTRQRVGNWPGVTVDRKTGEYRHEGKAIEVVDLPGIYSLSAVSLDEVVARNYILSGEAELIVNIVDASNLERNLYLTVQLLEMQVPLLVVLNMMDVAKENRVRIDVDALSKRLGCGVVPMVASQNKGLDELRSRINIAAAQKRISSVEVAYPDTIREAVDDLSVSIREKAPAITCNRRYAAVKLLEGDAALGELAGPDLLNERDTLLDALEEKLGEEADILIADARYTLIGRLTQDAVRREGRLGKNLSDRIDDIVLNRVMGIPIFLLAMYLMFMLTINVGGAFIDFFDIFTGTVFVDGFGHLLGLAGLPEWLIVILAGGIGGGIQTIATFIPPIGFMFLCLCFLEDSGYMARAAFVMDRFMRVIGLPGKSFVPMLVGFGCNVPAILATRTLENQRDRTLTIMMNPFMSCGARLPVYALFAAAFFPVGGQNLVFGLYLIGIAFAVLTGLILKNTLLKGEITPFVMELPPYHLPTVRGVLMRAWDRLKSFIFRAGKVIVPVVIVLSFLNSLGTDGSFGHEDSDSSALSVVGKAITPVFAPMGLTEENWPATVGIFTGIFAKEAVVGTLDALYTQMTVAEEGAEAAGEGVDFWGGIVESFATVPENLLGVLGTLTDPLGLSVGDMSDQDVAAEEQGVSSGTFGTMVRMFDGRIAAFAYLLFILLYFPCVAAIAAVYQETGIRWTLFAGAWTTGLAWTASVMFYQIATLGRHPVTSLAWIIGLVAVFAAVVIVMGRLGGQKPKTVTGVLKKAGV
ncbi:Fe(2+) transporter permease subunit FeoB [Desulfatiferula olefinivorans]